MLTPAATSHKRTVLSSEPEAVTDEIGQIILSGGNSTQIADQAEAEGVWDLRRSGLQKVIDGVTGLEEINRVTVD